MESTSNRQVYKGIAQNPSICFHSRLIDIYMSLYHPPDERSFRGKTSDREDMVNVRFVELAPPRRIVEAVSFVTTDPAFFGEMTIVVTFDEVPGGTDVTFLCENLPPGLRPQDNEAGSRLSLEQLARRFE